MVLTGAESVRISIRNCICKRWPLLALAIIETMAVMDTTFVPRLLTGSSIPCPCGLMGLVAARVEDDCPKQMIIATHTPCYSKCSWDPKCQHYLIQAGFNTAGDGPCFWGALPGASKHGSSTCPRQGTKGENAKATGQRACVWRLGWTAATGSHWPYKVEKLNNTCIMKRRNSGRQFGHGHTETFSPRGESRLTLALA